MKNSVNPAVKFIIDPSGSGKLVKFNLPIDLRTVDEKYKQYPFNQIWKLLSNFNQKQPH